jgi:hypothetical protein
MQYVKDQFYDLFKPLLEMDRRQVRRALPPFCLCSPLVASPSLLAL